MSEGVFDPEKVDIWLHGGCDYQELWEPGIKEWGTTDEDSRAMGCVSIQDYDKLLALYRSLRGMQ